MWDSAGDMRRAVCAWFIFEPSVFLYIRSEFLLGDNAFAEYNGFICGDVE
jgi:hypothetical protein